MKLIQLNAWGGRLEHQVGNLIHSQQPDILCLQEVISFSAGSGTGLFITTERIQQEFGLIYEAFAPVFSFNYMKGLAKFGNAIFSKLPIIKSEVVFTHMEHKDDFMWGEDSANMRNFVHATVDINDKTCHVLTHHGYWLAEHKNGNEGTMRQMDMLADYISKLDGPVILTGDFNLAPDSSSLKKLNSMLANLSVEYKLETTRTDLTHKREVCDYIFISPEIKVKKFQALEQVVSDHKALVLEFDL